MKQKDVALIVGIVGVAALFSFLLFSVVFGRFTRATIQVEKVEPISAVFQLPSEKYFNSNSLNPTQKIQISPDSNSTPFNAP